MALPTACRRVSGAVGRLWFVATMVVLEVAIVEGGMCVCAQ
jgi:hypothetical protein